MNDLLAMGMLHRLCEASIKVAVNFGSSDLALQIHIQAATCDVLHDKVRPTSIVPTVDDLHDVGMSHPCCSFHLDAEAGPIVIAGQRTVSDELDRYHSMVMSQLPGLVDHTHSTASQLLEQFIAR